MLLFGISLLEMERKQQKIQVESGIGEPQGFFLFLAQSYF